MSEVEKKHRGGREFCPMAKELIGYYLKNHILKRPYLGSDVIQDAIVFGENLNPWEKFCNPQHKWRLDKNSAPTLFLFTKLSNVGKTSMSANVQKTRTAGCGTWHGSSSGCKVYSSPKKNGVMIGYCRKLSFRTNNGEETAGQWTMYEYSICPKAFPEIQGLDWEDWVICRIKRDDTKSSIGGKVSKKRKGSASVMSEEEEDAPMPKEPRLDDEDEAEFVEGPGETSYREWEEMEEVDMTFDVDEFLNSLNQVS